MQESSDIIPQSEAAVEQARTLAASALDLLNSQTQTQGQSAGLPATNSSIAAPTASQKYKRPVRGPRTTWDLSDGTRAQYCQLIDYPLADIPLPAGTTCLDIVTHYPNHFCGENLEAFLQYFWTAEMIVKYMPDTIKTVLIAQGIHREEAPLQISLGIVWTPTPKRSWVRLDFVACLVSRNSDPVVFVPLKNMAGAILSGLVSTRILLQRLGRHLGNCVQRSRACFAVLIGSHGTRDMLEESRIIGTALLEIRLEVRWQQRLAVQLCLGSN